MYRSFTIKNFRCFDDFTIDPLERVNLIAGRNNTGKTALLEALFLHLGGNNVELPLSLNYFRGFNRMTTDPADTWGWLFNRRNSLSPIELVGHTGTGELTTVEIRLELGSTTQSPLGEPDSASTALPFGSLTTSIGPRELVMSYRSGDQPCLSSRLALGADGTPRIERQQVAPAVPGVFLSTRARFHLEDADRFSKLERVGRENEILAPLRLLDPRLKRLAVLLTVGTAMINGDLGLGELVPVALMGEGFARVMSILLAISTASGGVVLVDEIENGLHYSVLEGVWAAIAEAARRSDVQVVATTHSWECIQAAQRAFLASGAYDLRLHRLDLIDDRIRSVAYDEETLGTSIDLRLEVR